MSPHVKKGAGLEAMGVRARQAGRQLSGISSSAKDRALLNIADALDANHENILDANERDILAGKKHGINDILADRLVLNTERLKGMADDVRSVAALSDPVGEVLETRELPNGLYISRKRVPLGVIGAIYESRPNVTVDIAVLCIKSGNSVLLRGGKEALHSNTILATIIRNQIATAGVPKDAVQFIESTDRSLVKQMLSMKDYIDLVIPRGGAALIHKVSREAAMPAITGGVGVCHTYVDCDADINMAVSITYNAKVSRPYVCNALDTILVHSSIAPVFLPTMAEKMSDHAVELRCDQRAFSILEHLDFPGKIVAAKEEDWGKEFLSLTAAVKTVDSLDEALQHIQRYNSGHTEAIVTDNESAAERFLNEVDSGVVMVNSSTRFNDGAQFGLGAEVGISTSKIHARGPMGLKELTSYKWTVIGTGQIRA